MEYVERDLPSDIKFIQQSCLETYHVFGTIPDARDTEVAMPGQNLPSEN